MTDNVAEWNVAKGKGGIVTEGIVKQDVTEGGLQGNMSK